MQVLSFFLPHCQFIWSCRIYFLFLHVHIRLEYLKDIKNWRKSFSKHAVHQTRTGRSSERQHHVFLFTWINSQWRHIVFHHKVWPVRLIFSLQMFSYTTIFISFTYNTMDHPFCCRETATIQKKESPTTITKRNWTKEMDMVIASTTKCHNWKRRQT